MNATVDNTVNVATVINAAGLGASIAQSAGETAVVSYSLPVAAVVQPSQSINLITVSGPQGPAGPPGSGVLNLTGQYPIFYDAGSGVIGIVSGYYVTFPDLTSASGALVTQISAASAGVNAINGLSGFVTFAAINPLFISVAGQTISISGSGLATSGDLTRYYLNSNPQGYARSGDLAALSGYANTLIAATGQAAWTAAQNNAVNLSGAIQATGQTLYALITGATGAPANVSGYITTGQADARYYPLSANPSGYITSGQTDQFATITTLQATGAVLVQRDLDISGVLQGQINAIGANPSGFITTGQTGQFYAASNPQQYASSGFATGVSGALQIQINALPTAAQLAQTGSDLYRLITGESGQGVIDYATKVQLTQSGVNLISYTNGMGTNLSGQLTATGQLLSAVRVTGSSIINSVNLTGLGGTLVIWSGDKVFISGAAGGGTGDVTYAQLTGASGALQQQITQSSAGVVTLNGLSGNLNLVGTGGITVSQAGQIIYISGQNWATSGDIGLLSGWTTATFATIANLYQTGANLYGMLVAESGALIAQIAATGQQAWTAANNNGINLSGQLGSLSGQAEATYVHRTGAELVSGAKTLVNTTQFLSNLRFTAVNQSASFTLAAGTYRYIWSGAANCTGTLPAPSATSGIEFMVKNLSPTGSLVLSGLIDYSQNYALTPMQGVTLWSDNTSWLLV